MKKNIYWLVENNADLSVTVKYLEQAKDLIEADFQSQNENGKFDIDDLQYTITPNAMTQEEYDNLPDAN